MATRSSPSLARRALLAVLLTIGFYGLALTIAIGLIALPYLEWRFAHRVHLQLLVFSLGAAVALALRQRGWRVEALPGAKLTLRHGTDVIEPFDVLDTLHEPAAAEAWWRECDRLYLTDTPLVPTSKLV